MQKVGEILKTRDFEKVINKCIEDEDLRKLIKEAYYRGLKDGQEI